MMARVTFLILTSISNVDCFVHAFNRGCTKALATRAGGAKYSSCPSLDRIPFAKSSRNQDNSSDHDHDDLIRELRETKKQMYGADIPIDDEIKQATLNAENEFLAAMLEQTQQFNQIKSEQGSDRAVELFMCRIQEEQNPRGGAEQNDEGAIAEECVEKKWFVRRIQEEQNPGMTRDVTHEDWQ
jgi:hypothetical protein